MAMATMVTAATGYGKTGSPPAAATGGAATTPVSPATDRVLETPRCLAVPGLLVCRHRGIAPAQLWQDVQIAPRADTRQGVCLCAYASLRSPACIKTWSGIV